MLICLDIGNTHIYSGVFEEEEIRLHFRYPATTPCTSDSFGVFLVDVLEKNKIDPTMIDAIAICSVVPAMNYTITAACKKYFSIDPFILQPGVKTGLRLAVKNPPELGADRIANAIAAINLYPNKDVMIIDFGTATTICAVSNKSGYLGGAILPGFKLSMQALSSRAAKLSDVDIIRPATALGKTTAHNLQSGLYYGQLGALKEIITRITTESFPSSQPLLIATGGYAHLFEPENYFSVVIPDLVLHGLRFAYTKNLALASNQ